ncbi:ReoY family proteolytic degradation factor [Lacticigenium naphthae]|uniref:ReoY family proteolytic degradation factor n=1 Tax=Lacticigenium naphthae TaxID=515351 RepID=UPI000422737E|nr:ReoY family proteolytic degradation factor [Lacticigenium naphthae]
MKWTIPLEQKKKFLSWFLENNQLKRRESMWILNYLLNHDIVLNKVHFVERADKTPRGIIMSTIESDADSFLFSKEGVAFDNPEQAFHEVRLNWHQDLYIELIFNDAWTSSEYLGVLEDNPYFDWNDTIPMQVKQKATLGISEYELLQQRDLLLSHIDKALENKNKESFAVLSQELIEIEKKLEEHKHFSL